MKFLRWGIILIIFCLPIYLIKFTILKIPTTALELLIYVLVIIWFLKGGYRNLWDIVKHERLLVWGIVFFLLGVSVATMFSWDLRTSAGIWKAWFVDPILFFTVFITVIKKEDIKNVFKSIIFSGVVVALISLVYLICGKLNYQGRLQEFSILPNYLAMYLAVPLLLSLWFALKEFRGTARGFYGIIFLVLSIVIFFTKSFGALFGLIGAMGFGLIVYLYCRNREKIVLGIIIIGFVVVLIIGLWKIHSLEGLRSFDARFIIWKSAIDAFLENPVTGIGPGTFEAYFPPYPKWGVPQPHNIFLAFLIQTGLIGFVGFTLILIWFYKKSTKNLVLLCIMTYFLMHGLVDTTYWKNDLSLSFWTIIGAVTILQFYRIEQSVAFINKK